jgi:hypothetical protein
LPTNWLTKHSTRTAATVLLWQTHWIDEMLVLVVVPVSDGGR